MKIQLHGRSAFAVSSNAHWTLNALAGGYAKVLLPNGTVSDFAKNGPHKVLMEGLESFAALLATGIAEDSDERRYALTSDGKRFLSAKG